MPFLSLFRSHQASLIRAANAKTAREKAVHCAIAELKALRLEALGGRLANRMVLVDA